MRDPKRIDRIMDMYKKIWGSIPRASFCETYVALFGSNDNFYTEDDYVERHLKHKSSNITDTFEKRDTVEEIIEKFTCIWSAVPDWRFCQLYVNLFGRGDNSDIDDETIIQILDQTLRYGF